MAGMLRYAATRVGDNPKYTKTPGPWLNDERWKDVPAPTQRHAATGRQGSNLFNAFQEIIDADTSQQKSGRRDHVDDALNEILDACSYGDQKVDYKRDNVSDAFDEIIDAARRREHQPGQRRNSVSRRMDNANALQDRIRTMSPTAAAYASFLNPDGSTEDGK